MTLTRHCAMYIVAFLVAIRMDTNIGEAQTKHLESSTTSPATGSNMIDSNEKFSSTVNFLVEANAFLAEVSAPGGVSENPFAHKLILKDGAMILRLAKGNKEASLMQLQVDMVSDLEELKYEVGEEKIEQLYIKHSIDIGFLKKNINIESMKIINDEKITSLKQFNTLLNYREELKENNSEAELLGKFELLLAKHSNEFDG